MKRLYDPKPLFIERMRRLLKDEEDVKKFFETAKTEPKKSFRVNTLKIKPKILKEKLMSKGWKVEQYKDMKDVFQLTEELDPGALGNSIEHLLGYFYVQEITSMMPILVLDPKPDELYLDLCAAPGSKTTQAAALMDNQGTIFANDLNLGRIKILSANLERFGVTNSLVFRHQGVELCSKLRKLGFMFDKILVDAPCSGEGNCRVSPRTFLEWSPGLLNSLSQKQKPLLKTAFDILRPGGTLIYSTCTHSPEENELVVQNLLDQYENAKIEKIKLPIKFRQGLTSWEDKTLNPDMKNCARIYHHDNDLEGFFLCKIKKLE